MGLHLHDAGLLTVKQGASVSNIFNAQSAVGSVSTGGLDIFCPQSFGAETYSVQVAPVKNPQAADWVILQWQPGTDVALAAGRCVSIPFGAGFRAIRIFTTTPGGAVQDRAFRLMLQLASDDDAGI